MTVRSQQGALNRSMLWEVSIPAERAEDLKGVERALTLSDIEAP